MATLGKSLQRVLRGEPVVEIAIPHLAPLAAALPDEKADGSLPVAERRPTSRAAPRIPLRVPSESETPSTLEVHLSVPEIRWKGKDSWSDFKNKAHKRLQEARKEAKKYRLRRVKLLFAGNALSGRIESNRAEELQELKKIDAVDLSPYVQVTRLDRVAEVVRLEEFRRRYPSRDGRGVRVAVLDTGVDPILRPTLRRNGTSEADEVYGGHGTHCAGCIASTDSRTPGIAPGVDLLAIKAADREGFARPEWIAKAIDLALDAKADVISISLGYSQLASPYGHDWNCPNGDCLICRAVGNAVRAGAVVVAAAGNEHQGAQALRRLDEGLVPTEITCPGHARGGVVTVGGGDPGKDGRHWAVLPRSSRGLTRYGDMRPTLIAPGSQVRSVYPPPRDRDGRAIGPTRGVFLSGSSPATAIVAGAVALIVQHFKELGKTWKPEDVVKHLLASAVEDTPLPRSEEGAGRLILVPGP